jgi:hypothetical protein
VFFDKILISSWFQAPLSFVGFFRHNQRSTICGVWFGFNTEVWNFLIMDSLEFDEKGATKCQKSTHSMRGSPYVSRFLQIVQKFIGFFIHNFHATNCKFFNAMQLRGIIIYMTNWYDENKYCIDSLVEYKAKTMHSTMSIRFRFIHGCLDFEPYWHCGMRCFCLVLQTSAWANSNSDPSALTPSIFLKCGYPISKTSFALPRWCKTKQKLVYR